MSRLTRIRNRLFSACAIALVAGTFAPRIAIAQGSVAPSNQQNDAAIPVGERLVALDAENARLVDILPDLMKGVGADYALDREATAARVTIHITRARLKDVLNVVAKVSTVPLEVKNEGGLFHFVLKPPPPPAKSPEKTVRRPGPPYNGGDPIAGATSELFTYLIRSEIVLGGRSTGPAPGSLVIQGGGSLSGSRNFSDYGFINGHFTSSSLTIPDINTPWIRSATGGGGYFGPFKTGN